jgi:phosphoesterase RecJ-like protein
LRIAADLIGAGADLPTIIDWIWGRTKYAAAKLLGAALSSLQVSANGRIAWAVLREEDFHTASAREDDTEGIIDHIRSIQDARVAVLFSEKQGEIRGSLRSTGEVDVAKLAGAFGGGGHVKAAGFSYQGPIEYAVCDVLRVIENAMR